MKMTERHKTIGFWINFAIENRYIWNWMNIVFARIRNAFCITLFLFSKIFIRFSFSLHFNVNFYNYMYHANRIACAFCLCYSRSHFTGWNYITMERRQVNAHTRSFRNLDIYVEKCMNNWIFRRRSGWKGRQIVKGCTNKKY